MCRLEDLHVTNSLFDSVSHVGAVAEASDKNYCKDIAFHSSHLSLDQLDDLLWFG